MATTGPALRSGRVSQVQAAASFALTARGFLLKDAGPALLTQAIHAAADGDALIAPSNTVRLLATFADAHAGPPPAQPVEPLTFREEGILLPVARGRTNSEIAIWAHETGRIST